VCCEFKELTLAMANMQRIAIGLFFFASSRSSLAGFDAFQRE
jgi:hypothetical protein